MGIFWVDEALQPHRNPLFSAVPLCQTEHSLQRSLSEIQDQFKSVGLLSWSSGKLVWVLISAHALD